MTERERGRLRGGALKRVLIAWGIVNLGLIGVGLATNAAGPRIASRTNHSDAKSMSPANRSDDSGGQELEGKPWCQRAVVVPIRGSGSCQCTTIGWKHCEVGVSSDSLCRGGVSEIAVPGDCASTPKGTLTCVAETGVRTITLGTWKCGADSGSWTECMEEGSCQCEYSITVTTEVSLPDCTVK